MRLARVLGAIGRTLITAGVLILLFVAYQLWGTGIHEARAQNRLEDQFADRMAEYQESVSSTSTTDGTPADPEEDTAGTTSTTQEAPPLPPIAEGESLGFIRIPEIGVDKVFLQGVSLRDLKEGPGHYAETPYPGNPGNAAIAGHRTTYGQPFHNLDLLVPGDKILVSTLQGDFEYQVLPQLTDQVDENGEPVTSGHFIVTPDQVEVLEDKGDNRLTLTACHPKYSARQRIVVTAELVEEPAAPPPTTATTAPTESAAPPSFEGLDDDSHAIWPAVAWGAAAAMVWLVAWLVAKRWRRWPAYAAGLPIFLVLLFVFFENFSRLLPASY